MNLYCVIFYFKGKKLTNSLQYAKNKEEAIGAALKKYIYIYPDMIFDKTEAFAIGGRKMLEQVKNKLEEIKEFTAKKDTYPLVEIEFLYTEKDIYELYKYVKRTIEVNYLTHDENYIYFTQKGINGSYSIKLSSVFDIRISKYERIM